MKKKVLAAVIASSLILSNTPSWIENVQAASTAQVVKSVNFRTGPSTSSDRIRYLKTGEHVEILEKVNSYWYKVKDQNGRIGYVTTMDQYIQVKSDERYNAEIVYGVSFRTGPSTSYQRMRYLKKGEKVTILSQPNQYWYQVRDQYGQVGYVSSNSKYIRIMHSNSTGSSTGANSGTSSPTTNPSVLAQRVIDAGMKYLGTPYEYGSDRSSTATFDCSAFVRRAFIDGAGIVLPMDSRKQGDYVKKIGKTTTNWRNLQPGDLMFFMAYKGTAKSHYTGIDKSKQTITHVGIYLGDGKILHTYSKESGGVRIDNIQNRHWEYRFIFGGSVF